VIGYAANQGTGQQGLATALTYYTVVETPPVSTTGTYIVNASAVLLVIPFDTISCNFALASSGLNVGGDIAYTVPGNAYDGADQNIPVSSTSAFSVNAGDSIQFVCAGQASTVSNYSEVYNGNLTAILLTKLN
jgi:hypothetical protein